METRYRQDIKLPDSGLTGLELITEMYITRQIGIDNRIPEPDGVDCHYHKYLFHCIPRFALNIANLLYGSTDAILV